MINIPSEERLMELSKEELIQIAKDLRLFPADGYPEYGDDAALGFATIWENVDCVNLLHDYMERALKRIQEIYELTRQNPDSEKLKGMLKKAGFDVRPYITSAGAKCVSVYGIGLGGFLEGVVELVQGLRYDEQEWIKEVFYRTQYQNGQRVMYWPDYKW